jgi:mannosyl-oligosaccharide alpha-1,2-mannosidase
MKQWGEVSVFEINIRFVGGLLSCFALTGDRMFREKAFLIAERLLPAFDTPTGIPLGIVNMENGVRIKYAHTWLQIPGIIRWYLE